jgi:lipopolysaccharide transport system permease protein
MFFAEMLGRSVNIFIEQAGLLKKVSFPKLCLPIIVVASSSLSFVIVLALFLIFLLIIGHFPGWVILSMIPVLILQAALATGLGILLSTINVFYRDINQTVSVVLQFWFWLTPIVYPASIIPERVQTILEFNPVWPLIRAYHTIFLDRSVPDWTGLAYPFILSVVFVWLGIFAFFKLQGEIVDEL